MTRDQEISERYRAGATQGELSARFGVTRQRITQILHRGADAEQKAAIELTARTARLAARYDVSYEEMWAMRSFAPKVIEKYFQQRRGAETRGIAWEFSLRDWWAAWQESGKWSLRGSGRRRYCMGRFGDRGPYSTTNVYICTNRQNGLDGLANRAVAFIPKCGVT